MEDLQSEIGRYLPDVAIAQEFLNLKYQKLFRMIENQLIMTNGKNNFG